MRNFSPQKMFEHLASKHRPSCTFDGKVGFSEWKAHTKPKVLATLGADPPAVPTDAELLAEWADDGVRKQRWLINVQEMLAATVLVARPESSPETTRLPAILCWHGHGSFGKESVMKNDFSPERRREIEDHNYAYGHIMAKSGFVTYAIDWMGFGDHCETGKPNWNSMAGSRDWCNLYYLHATMLGMTPLSVNLAHGRQATTFVADLPFVDPDRIGVMGLSGGGTMTLWSALTDERIKAAEIICYSAYWPLFGFRDINYCGMQVAPGLFSLVHLHDLQGLLAPMPLLVDVGANDSCFPVDESLRCFRGLERIYEAAGARDRLELDLHPGEHGWGGNRSARFFRRHLSSIPVTPRAIV